MRNSIKFITVIGLAVSTVAVAKTDVKGALGRLQTNEKNAKENLKQYESNRDISKKNAEEVTKAINELRAQRKSLTQNSRNLEKNRAILDAMKVKIGQFKAQEQKALQTEQAQRAQLQALIDQLDANKLQREQNIASYDVKIQEIETEKMNWDQQQAEMTAIHKEIDTKEKVALNERKKWINKHKGYSAETKKWDKQANVAEETRVKFEHLNK